MERTLLTLPEVAKILSVYKEYAYVISREGMLPTVQIGRQLRVYQEQLDESIQNGGLALFRGWRCSGHE